MNSAFLRLCYLVFPLLLIGCAFGKTTNYRGYSEFGPAYDMPPINLGVMENRPYVLDGSKDLSYCGTHRSIGGVPYNMNTASGNPLVEDLCSLLSESLRRYDVYVLEKSIPMGISEQEAARKLSSDGRKSILLILNEWRTHIYFNPTLDYNLKMCAINEDGEIITDIIDSGTVAFGPKQEIQNLAVAVKKIYGGLFNHPQIKKALLTGNADNGIQIPQKVNQDKIIKNAPCTVEQILKMKEMGMSDNQIKAACE